MFRQQAHNRKRGHALAAPGFDDQPQCRTIGHAQVNPVDCVRGAATVAMEEYPQIFDFDQWGDGHFRSATAASIEASMILRSVTPAGFLRLGRNLRKCTQRWRLPCSSRSRGATG